MKLQNCIAAACFAAFMSVVEATAQWNVIEPNQNPARTFNATPPAQPRAPQTPPQIVAPQRPAPPSQPHAANARPPRPPSIILAPPRQPPRIIRTNSRTGSYHVIPVPAGNVSYVNNDTTYINNDVTYVNNNITQVNNDVVFIAPLPAPAAPPPASASGAAPGTPAAAPGASNALASSASPDAAPKDDSVFIGQISSGGDVKTLSVPEGSYTNICFELVSGAVELRTVWLRPEETEVPVSAFLLMEQAISIDLGEQPRKITGLRISDSGKGVYKISAQ